MKIKFLKDINEYGEHVIRLDDFDKDQAILFHQILIDLAEGNKAVVVLSVCEFIEMVNCELTLRIAETDEGIITDDFEHFFCELTAQAYNNMAQLVIPFCRKDSNSYQYLYDLDNPIDFLLSAGRV